MTYYNISKILEIMKNYHIYHDNLTTDNKDYASVGVTVYGIEATLPKPLKDNGVKVVKLT